MIPRKLTIEGVYSYKNRQVIDFSTLSEAGIFGVFGNVGSGKSAILESMTYALYGQIERLNDKEQRGYNIMNLQSSALFIDFEFTQDTADYRFTVISKRNKKDFNKIQSPERAGYKREGTQWIPLQDEGVRGGITAEGIIGLNYEHFRKTVIIPQGKFQEFIQLPPSQRTGMIETLFGLQRFNLSADCNYLLARSREECSFLEGRLEDLQELNEADLESLKLKSREIEDDLQRKSAQKKELNEQIAALAEYRKSKRALDETTQKLEALEAEKEEILKKEILLEKSLKLDELFSMLLVREQEITRERKELIAESEHLEQEGREIQGLLKEGEEYWLRLKKDQEMYPQLRKNLDSLKALREIKEIIKKQDQDALRTALISKEMTSCRAELRQLNDERKAQISLIAKLEEQIDTKDDISEIEDWFRHMDSLSEKRSDLLDTISSLNKKENLSAAELREIFSSVDLTSTDSPAEMEKKILNKIQKQEEDLNRKEEIHSEQLRTAGRIRLLRELSETLEEGKPCPLCGSEHHPGAHGLISENSKSAEQEELDQLRQSIQDQKERLLTVLPGLKFLEQERTKNEDRLIRHDELEKSHKAGFKWTILKADEREKFNTLKGELTKHRSELKELRQKVSILDIQIKKSDSMLHEKEGEQIRLETNTEHLNKQKNALEVIILEDHKTRSPDSEEYRSLQKRLDDLDRDYLRIRSSREKDEKKLQDLKNRIQSTGHLISKSSDELSALVTDIQNKMDAQSLSGREELNRYLNGIEGLKSDRKKIEAFHKNRDHLIELKESLGSDVERLKRVPALNGADETALLGLQERLQTLEDELQKILTGAGALGEQIDDLRAKLELKKNLSENLDKQKIREENLKELSSLFKGGKFVQYIASVYMQEMCQIANRRFSPLTARSLELVFQDNQIMVRDFLNEGRLRHIKTLSGGQSFQAALCLALALAEQTGRGKGSFFFLDEGFGSLDKESLETVMATLRELSREGRIIGLISHVEEMQQDLDVWIRINRDSEEGSLIQNSWKSSPGSLKG